MARRQLGIEHIAGWPRDNQHGRIHIFNTAQERTAAGFTMNRQRLTADDDVGVYPNWNPDIETGWYIYNGLFSANPPRTDLQELQDETNATLDQFDAWDVLLDVLAHGYDPSLVQTGHDYLWRKRGGLYILLNDSTRSVADKLAIVRAARMGALDITGVSEFYTSFEGDPGVTISDWITWVDPSDASRVNLLDSMIVTGTVPDAVALYARQWVEDLM